MEKSFLYSFFWVARKLFMLKKNYPNQQTQKGWETLMGLDVWNLVTLTSSGGGEGGDQSFKTNGL